MNPVDLRYSTHSTPSVKGRGFRELYPIKGFYARFYGRDIGISLTRLITPPTVHTTELAAKYWNLQPMLGVRNTEDHSQLGGLIEAHTFDPNKSCLLLYIGP